MSASCAQIETEKSECDLVRWIQTLPDTELLQESPIDINIAKTTTINLPPLEWHNYEIPPKKMKLTNTGHSCSGKWHQERPYICNGPLPGNYVFSQLHFHWGCNDGEGSEHTMDGVRYPAEMHVVTFRSCYLTQESALKERDGTTILVYMFKLQTETNPYFQTLIDTLLAIQLAHCSVPLDPFPLDLLIRVFAGNYFMYWGTIGAASTTCTHYLLWLLSREPIGVSTDQMENLRVLLNEKDELIVRNFRDTQPKVSGAQLFVVCPAGSCHSSLLPIPKKKKVNRACEKRRAPSNLCNH